MKPHNAALPAQMIHGVAADGVHVTNPVEVISLADFAVMASSAPVLRVRRQDVLGRRAHDGESTGADGHSTTATAVHATAVGAAVDSSPKELSPSGPSADADVDVETLDAALADAIARRVAADGAPVPGLEQWRSCRVGMVCLPATCLPAYLPTCLPSYLPTCLPALAWMDGCTHAHSSKCAAL
jgi:hypothetical protein